MRTADWILAALIIQVLAYLETEPVIVAALWLSSAACVVAAVIRARRTR